MSVQKGKNREAKHNTGTEDFVASTFVPINWVSSQANLKMDIDFKMFAEDFALMRVPPSKVGIGVLWYYRAQCSESLVSDDMYSRNINWNIVPSDDLIKLAKENDAIYHVGDYARSASLRREDADELLA